MENETKFIMLTQQEAELILDSFKVSNPLTRGLALKTAGLVLEWAATTDVAAATSLLQPASGHTPGN